MHRSLSVIVLCTVSLLCLSPETRKTELQEISYYGRDSFLLEGTVFPDSVKESPYDRLPLSSKQEVRERLWKQAKTPAGMSVRFRTNSTVIKVKWTILNKVNYDHMARTGIKGVDLYVKQDNGWRYVNTGRPSGPDNEAVMVRNMKPEMREFRIYLPLYDVLTDLEIGIDVGSLMKKPEPEYQRPIVFYGTSITQGGCASRPGMAHTNIISRKLGLECINFGFSASGRMDEHIARLISNVDARFYVIACLQNMKPDQIRERALPLLEIIREKQPAVPVIFVGNIMKTSAFLNSNLEQSLENENEVLRDEYRKMLDKNFRDIYYIDASYALGADNEGTVDGLHLTDLGFMKYADFYIQVFRQLGLDLADNKK